MTATPAFSRGDTVTVIKPDTNVTGQSGRVFSMQDQGTTVDVDFPMGGLFRIPAADLRNDTTQ